MQPRSAASAASSAASTQSVVVSTRASRSTPVKPKRPSSRLPTWPVAATSTSISGTARRAATATSVSTKQDAVAATTRSSGLQTPATPPPNSGGVATSSAGFPATWALVSRPPRQRTATGKRSSFAVVLMHALSPPPRRSTSGRERTAAAAVPQRQHLARSASGDDVLARVEQDDAHAGAERRDLRVRPRGEVPLAVELDAEEAQPPADVLADRGRALAHARGEDEAVEAVERDGGGRDRAGDPVGEDVEREPRRRLGRPLELLHPAGDPGEAEQ